MVIYNIIEDTGFYWVHVWMHTPWAYKNFHFRHHEHVNVFSLTGEIAHPVEFVCNFLVPIMAGYESCVSTTTSLFLPARFEN
jgi:Delta7-sterol 5-desaturase